MTGFHYIDIFATKGIEYLIVIGFLFVLIIFWQILSGPRQRAANWARGRMRSVGHWFLLARDRYYHQGHSWAKPEKGNLVKVGIDDFATKFLGAPKAIEVPQPGSQIEQGEIGWRLKVDSRKVEMLAPVTGKVVAVNKKVLEHPELLERDPYNEGWLLEVETPKLRANLRNLLSGRLAREWMEDTAESLRRMLAPKIGATLQDGGLPVNGFARSVWPENWDEIAAEFFKTKAEVEE
ncbi:MAG TPA: glycine cleavage system protein H [Bacteroidetes bacterium]|nr:glycine cleavage system protein H [Bacteroidota bacterium]